MIIKGSNKERLFKRALCLKKAWILCAGIVGIQKINPPLTEEELTIPDYSRLSRKELQNLVDDLEDDVERNLQRYVDYYPDKNRLLRIAQWLGKHFDKWKATGWGLYTISTVKEFEQNVGQLRIHEYMEAPPYGEMLLQGGYGLTIRHPEYMLVRDIGLLYDLFTDAERLSEDQYTYSEWFPCACENRQALARMVIIGCFNLLEAFTSGIARAHLMTKTVRDEREEKKLRDTSKPLRTRLVTIASIAAGKTSLDVNKPPMSLLFGPIKEHRDAFIHCEPGPDVSERGLHKENLFHDVSRSVVDDTVKSTFEIIRTVWQDVHSVSGPRWLPDLKDGRLGKQNLRLNPQSYNG